ncbi:MAG: hypothetical protein ACI8W8_004926 [Rhodothermales bacterium]|jgi:hypothetical protein
MAQLRLRPAWVQGEFSARQASLSIDSHPCASLRIPRKKKSDFVAVPIAAMADIAFLLIIFFMIPTTVAKEHAIDLALPEALKHVEGLPVCGQGVICSC